MAFFNTFELNLVNLLPSGAESIGKVLELAKAANLEYSQFILGGGGS